MRRQVERITLFLLPKYTLTAFVGWLSRKRFSRRFIPLYIRIYKINVAECERAPSQCANLLDFFCRTLKSDAREIHSGCISSPVDGTVSECGLITKGTLVQAKGHTYALASLLGDEHTAMRFENGTYITIYLSPADYHRIHAPCDALLSSWRHIPGALFPVNPKGVRAIDGLFARNERLVTLMATEYGDIAMVKVGATIVGSIRTDYGPEYESALLRKSRAMTEGNLQSTRLRGEEIGRFEFGSTVILLFTPETLLKVGVHSGDKVQLGQPIAFASPDA